MYQETTAAEYEEHGRGADQKELVGGCYFPDIHCVLYCAAFVVVSPPAWISTSDRSLQCFVEERYKEREREISSLALISSQTSFSGLITFSGLEKGEKKEGKVSNRSNEPSDPIHPTCQTHDRVQKFDQSSGTYL